MTNEQSEGQTLAPPTTGDMSAEEFRRHGHALIDRTSDYFTDIEARPVLAQVKPRELIAQLPQAPPAAETEGVRNGADYGVQLGRRFRSLKLALNEHLMHAANSTGSIFISHTRLNNQFTLRLAVGNIRTTEGHVRRAGELLNKTLQTNL